LHWIELEKKSAPPCQITGYHHHDATESEAVKVTEDPSYEDTIEEADDEAEADRVAEAEGVENEANTKTTLLKIDATSWKPTTSWEK
jgi:hypothetical protein